MKWVKRIAVGVVVVGVLAYLGVLAGLYFLQRDFQYDRSGRMFALSETLLTGAELVSIPSADGSALAAWYQAPAAGMPVIGASKCTLFAPTSRPECVPHEPLATMMRSKLTPCSKLCAAISCAQAT